MEILKKIQLDNGIKLIYHKVNRNITSFCIGFNAGACKETEKEIGLSHVVEHMIFKGTKKRSEFEINECFDELYGFNNAMTNFPYAIYYGTTLSENFEAAFELYSDILVNPTFMEAGFEEEINVILEELKEWKDDNFQFCEDEMLKNAFKKRRIKEGIIGTVESIKTFKRDDVESFYNKYYTSKNCVICVVTNLELELVAQIIEKYMNGISNSNVENNVVIYENNKAGIFESHKEGMQGAKLQYIFDIQNLSNRELSALKIFNLKFGEGTSSILYDEIRTKNELAYEVFSKIKYEEGIKLFTICAGTSKENVEKAIKIINNIINNYNTLEAYFNDETIGKIIKRLKLKDELAVEKSIELAKKVSTNEIMFGIPVLENIDNITKDEIIDTIKKVLNKPTIQILS